MQKRQWILPVFLAMCTVVVSCGRTSAPDAVFLIIVDTLRPDRLSAYGYEEHETPHMDRLAKRGVRFVHAQSPTLRNGWSTNAAVRKPSRCIRSASVVSDCWSV